MYAVKNPVNALNIAHKRAIKKTIPIKNTKFWITTFTHNKDAILNIASIKKPTGKKIIEKPINDENPEIAPINIPFSVSTSFNKFSFLKYIITKGAISNIKADITQKVIGGITANKPIIAPTIKEIIEIIFIKDLFNILFIPSY